MMKRKTIWCLIAWAALTAAFAPGCKKKDDTVVLPSLDGSLYYQMLPYLRAGDVVTLNPMGVTHPEGEGIGYYWIVPFGDKAEKRDTVKKENEDKTPQITFTIPSDASGLYSTTCTAFAKGYYSTSYEADFYVVDPEMGGSLTETGIRTFEAHITDSRDTRENFYYTTSAGGLTWMRNNLAWSGAGVPFMGCEVMSYPLGRFYTWDEAQTACPEGWRLPTDDEWKALGDDAGALMVNARMFDERLWEYWPEVNITNSTRLGILPAGYAIRGDHDQFTGFTEYAVFWTATSNPEDASQALCRYINVKLPDIFVGSRDKASFGASVRCVK